MSPLRKSAALLAVAVVLGGVSAILNPGARAVLANAPRGDELTLEEANSTGPAAIWIDARNRAAYDAGHVKGALLLNEDDWSELLVPVIERWKPGVPVVVYCDTGGCQASRRVAERLRTEAGVDTAKYLRGDWKLVKRTP